MYAFKMLGPEISLHNKQPEMLCPASIVSLLPGRGITSARWVTSGGITELLHPRRRSTARLEIRK